MYEDKTLVCKECGKEFVFTAGEQEFYAEKGFVNEPQRCRTAARPAKTPPIPSGRCTPQCAPPAAKRRGCPSSPGRTALSIAANVLPE